VSKVSITLAPHYLVLILHRLPVDIQWDRAQSAAAVKCGLQVKGMNPEAILSLRGRRGLLIMLSNQQLRGGKIALQVVIGSKII